MSVISDSDVPPILPNIEEQLRDYLICVENLPIHDFERNQQFWPREPNPSSLFHYEHSPLSTTLEVRRDLSTGKILKFEEVSVQNPGVNVYSKSLHGPRVDSIVGTQLVNSSFWGHGIPEVKLPDFIDKSSRENEEDEDLLVVPPRFSRGLVFETDGCTVKTNATEIEKSWKLSVGDNKKTIDLKVLIEQEQSSLSTVFQSKQDQKSEHDGPGTTSQRVSLPEEDEIIPKEPPLLFISNETTLPGHRSTEWAEVLDCACAVPDFERQIPRLAHEFPFELDNFQKLAIMQLEKHNHVLVAAHTSAGKTVIAEYAIALSQQHMTRAIYTSPIKALSNQKYRDFKDTFKDVGLITGDFQINQKASCLIMTTEILLSMLHCEGKISSDLEYVIFDEVHYINDKERGHVWEQVLIKLPAHVCIILLSATFPRPAEFADWLGRTKQKKVYVVSTYQRPVPLQHFLYTGREKGQGDSKYLIMGQKFVDEGYYTAVESLQRKKVPATAPQKGKQPGGKAPPTKKEPYRPHTNLMSHKEEKTLMYTLIRYMEKEKLLPAVMFIFSRANCDRLAAELANIDLTTQEEKGYIKGFFNISIKGLKPPDREIPQILRMRDILQRGVGVHHSGILPIIKEVVEMLFQTGKLKLLFTTETFAMGVNMPTRTVIFDSITKHDGSKRRNLTPAEYIQMAGRAGRRGKDKFGTVLILCKGQVPQLQSLKEIMLYRPSQLSSQFRLTYGMILNTLRGEEKNQTVEEVIAKSFMENDYQKETEKIQIVIKNIEKELEEVRSEELSEHYSPLITFYEWARSYLNLRVECWNKVVSTLRDVLIPGRILLITHKNHINKPAVLLTPPSPAAKVLVLADKDEPLDACAERDDEWYWMLGLAREQMAVPDSNGKHYVLDISCQDIFEVSSKKIPLEDPQLIIDDWKKRQIERFRNDPPGRTCEFALQELLKVAVKSGVSKEKALDCLRLIDDLPIKDVALYEAAQKINKEKEKFIDHLPFTTTPNFDYNFYSVFKRKHLEDKKNALINQLTSHMLNVELYSEYKDRVKLLQRIGYVSAENTVTYKGKVACCMSMNELLITELVYENVLMDLDCAEIAALLSVIVAKGRKKDQSKEELLADLPQSLLKAIEHLEGTEEEIKQLERECGIPNDDFAELNYGLVRVVYEWTSQKPFAKIMEFTDIQEGIIVRCIQQLNETICDVKSGAWVVGSAELQKKMEETSAALKRDIVFAASLYMNEDVCKHLKHSS